MDKEQCPHCIESQERVRVAEAAKNRAYSERNKLVAAISKLFPASLERHGESDKTWEDDWRWIVFIDLPSGQVSWHIHDSELAQFNHLKRGGVGGRTWDGHTTEEKYARLGALSPAPSAPKPEGERPCHSDNCGVGCHNPSCENPAPSAPKTEGEKSCAPCGGIGKQWLIVSENEGYWVPCTTCCKPAEEEGHEDS